MEYSGPRHSLRGFPVEFAALGFLFQERMHGYALRSRIEAGLGPLWHIASSQLYQVLRRLERRGFVTRRQSLPASGPQKSVYSVTDQGVEALRRWLEEPVTAMRNVRVEFAAKLYFTRLLNMSSVTGLIDRQLDAVDEMEARLHAEDRSASDDDVLNAAWLHLQQSTLANFRTWLRSHRTRLQSSKEIHE
jgi:DNA-binding PadR family transcriptional regulator